MFEHVDATPGEYTESDISPYFWHNGAFPQTAEYRALFDSGFADWRLKIGGLVENPVELSLDDLRALPRHEQITQHFCIQGWSGVAKWGGVSMSTVLDLVRPTPEAKWVVFYSLGDGPDGGLYYDAHALEHMHYHLTMLAYEMNGEPLSYGHGAPLRTNSSDTATASDRDGDHRQSATMRTPRSVGRRAGHARRIQHASPREHLGPSRTRLRQKGGPLVRTRSTTRRSAVAMACTVGAVGVLAATVLATTPSAGAATPPTGGTVGGFAYGELQSATVGTAGCGANTAGEPSLHVSKDNLVGLGSEEGVGSGSEFWRATQVGGTSAASACGLTYSGQPNGISHVGASGGDIDTAFAPVKSTAGTYRVYVASLNLGSVNVAVSNDNGATFTQTPVQAGLPVDDREWIAAYGAHTSLLTYHDIATFNIDVLRSDNGGASYTQIARVIPDTDYKAQNNELGNLVIDHNHPTAAGFWAYQSFVAPSADPGPTGSATYNEAFLGVSSDGGATWSDKPIPCTTKFGANGLDHNFPNVSVAPNGTLYYTVSNDHAIYVAESTDHGNRWTCSGAISSNSQAIFPWVVATSAGEDLVYYGATGSGAGQTWYVYFAQNRKQTVTGWKTKQLMPVHSGQVCEGGISCNGGRQLFDDFAVDTDQSGWAHIAYSHDAPNLGGSGTYTGYAVQQAGTPVGAPN